MLLSVMCQFAITMHFARHMCKSRPIRLTVTRSLYIFSIKMSNTRVLLFVAIVAVIICQTCIDAGPARSFAAVIAARGAKIPRSIRAPFRNTEMMTARGFGKRSRAPGKLENCKWLTTKLISIRHTNLMIFSLFFVMCAVGETAWGLGKGKYIDGLNPFENANMLDSITNEPIVDR